MKTPSTYTPMEPGEFIGKTQRIADVCFRRIGRADIKSPIRWLFTGPPGSGKSALARALAARMVQHSCMIEHTIGQSLTVDRVRAWCEDTQYRPIMD